ncbi:hypothetical protein K493DRAFT_325361 [Basidiobolus meristosporus CBS 931.73]|uniref:Creatinase/aminopeptidase n=1 Tax=Basidiobolus meristosporus CBS 931.73 TaxID=1314790 RepID=A0A1Y1Y2N9_9FUNG|nr:hypothetical protein K493DRAFT_325361 [Basidiobolus meristosporus CBS 931.73]|eukprot:ORX92277.1 hypothetical protein K493DRAFT_325361 [Basidiobolus meristosporus CBS 931.73]
MSMFVQPKKPEIELWEGARAGLEAAVDYFGADEAHEFTKFGHHIRRLFDSEGPIYVDFPEPMSLYSYEHAVKSLTSKENESSKIRPLAPIIQEHRLFKSKAEARLMRESGEISGKGFIEIMKATKPGVSEQTISALFEYECRKRGSQMLAYVPVVAGGKNALTMHYVNNNQLLREGDLLLVDAGGEYNGYASDITRTWPVNGKFSKQQKDLYKAVLSVQKQCIKMCTEDNNNSLNRVHDESVGLMKDELGKLGFKLDKWDVDRILYPHHVGHYLGLDLHDTFDMTRSRKLKSGMVVTIEPGLYVPYDDKFPKEYQGIGIRIEDNVLVGKEDPIILSVTAPKEVEDIEYTMSS